MLSIKWVDTDRGSKDWGAPPTRLPSGAALDSGSPANAAQPQAGTGRELRRQSCPCSFEKLSLPSPMPGVSTGKPALGQGCSSPEGLQQSRGAAAADRGRGSPEGPQPESHRDLGPGQGPIQRASDNEGAGASDPAAARGRALSGHTPRPGCLRAQRAARRRGSSFRNRCLPRPAGHFPPLSLALGSACEFLSLCTTRASSGDPFWRTAQPSPRAPGAQPQNCSPGSQGPRAPEASRIFLSLRPEPRSRGEHLLP